MSRRFLLGPAIGCASLLIAALAVRPSPGDAKMRVAEIEELPPSAESGPPPPPAVDLEHVRTPVLRDLPGPSPARRNLSLVAGQDRPDEFSEAEIVGSVVELPGERPVEGVWIRREFDRAGLLSLHGWRFRPVDLEARTDATGAFRVRVAPAFGRLRVESRRHLPVHVDYGPDDDRREMRVVLLRPEDLPAVSARVVDARGRPCARAQFRAHRIAEGRRGRGEAFEEAAEQAWRTLERGGLPWSDGDGRCEFRLPAFGTWVVEARVGRARVKRVVEIEGPGRVSLEMSLAEECRVRGRIVEPSGRPARSATILARLGRGLGGFTVNDGDFEMGGFAAGDQIRIEADGHGRASGPVWVAFGAPGETREIGDLVLVRP